MAALPWPVRHPMTLVETLPLLAAAMLLTAPLAGGTEGSRRGAEGDPPDWPGAWEWIWLLPAALALLAGSG